MNPATNCVENDQATTMALAAELEVLNIRMFQVEMGES